MALYQDLPVFADIYTLTHKVFLFTQDYPREYKFTLGQDMKRDCLVLLRSAFEGSNPSPATSKSQHKFEPRYEIVLKTFNCDSRSEHALALTHQVN